jgi:gamma-glutamylcyclotransferase (GGCT)/AIG2-like uncharacterized protein YtfP
MKHLFVYGTLKPEQQRWASLVAMAEHQNVKLNPRAGYARGMLYSLPQEFPAMTKALDKESIVKGYVVNLDGDPALVQALNEIEGFVPFGKHNWYTPVKFEVWLETGELLEDCWAYTFSRERIAESLKGQEHMKPARIESGNWDDEAHSKLCWQRAEDKKKEKVEK